MTACTAPGMQYGSRLGSPLREAAVQLLCLLLVLAVALVSLGPLVDHHFTERHPGHQHFYLGSADLSHPHNYANSHVHRDSWMYGAVGSQEGGGGANGVVFLMPNDGAGHGTADITVPMTMRPVRFGSDEGNRPPSAPLEVDTGFSGLSTSPSVPPPRA